MRLPRLHPDALERLTRLCGMLGSAHDAERAVAARKADELVRAAGLTWRDILQPPPALSTPWPAAPPPMTTRGRAQFCLQYPDLLSPWEVTFCLSIREQHRWSAKQRACMERIYNRVCEELRL